MEAQDILADDMDIRRPEGSEIPFRIIRIAESGDVVGKGVEPDVDDMPFIPRHRNPPGKGGAGNRKIAQPLANEIEDFVAPGARLNEVGICLDMPEQLLLVFAHAEEI